MKHISTLVEPVVHKKLVCEALEKGVSLQELQRQIIDEHLARNPGDANALPTHGGIKNV